MCRTDQVWCAWVWQGYCLRGWDWPGLVLVQAGYPTGWFLHHEMGCLRNRLPPDEAAESCWSGPPCHPVRKPERCTWSKPWQITLRRLGRRNNSHEGLIHCSCPVDKMTRWHTGWHTDWYTDTLTDTLRHGLTHWHIDRHTDRHDTWTHRHTDTDYM